MAYNQDFWAIKLNYYDQKPHEAIPLFTLLRKSSHQLITQLPEASWSSQISHPENGKMTMDDWLMVYADHIPLHIKQINRVYESWKKTR